MLNVRSHLTFFYVYDLRHPLADPSAKFIFLPPSLPSDGLLVGWLIKAPNY
jgi:hypothetical protein